MAMASKRNKKYDQVMSRVYDRSRANLKSSSVVTRHGTPSYASVRAKPSHTDVSSRICSELPVILNDYVPEDTQEMPPKIPVVKPRRTLKSLDTSKSPPRAVSKPSVRERPRITKVQSFTPLLVSQLQDDWPERQVRQCYSSRCHGKIKQLKDEIKAFDDTEKFLHLRSRLYKKFGVVLDDTGQLAENKAVQVTPETGYGSSAPITNGSAGSPLGRAAGSPPVSVAGAGPSPMAALMSVADTLPPGSPRSAGGSPPQAPQQRSNSRSSQHSPNSSGSNGGRRSSGSRHVSSTTSVSSSEVGEGTDTAPQPAPLLKCTLCQERLEDTHFVQCPSQPHHKFCFPCSRDSIKRQQGSEVYCPSGEKCPLANSSVPWAFMQGEIATILGEEFKPKKERET